MVIFSDSEIANSLVYLTKGMIGTCLHSYVVDRACLPVSEDRIVNSPTHTGRVLEEVKRIVTTIRTVIPNSKQTRKKNRTGTRKSQERINMK